MKSTNLTAEVRSKSGKEEAGRLREHHKIPGIIYGRGMENLMVEFSEMDIDSVVRNLGEHAVVNLDVNGKNIKTIIKEVQRDPINRNIEHVDMKYVSDDERVHSDVPIVIKGEGIINSKGLIVQKQLGYISVESTPDKLPRYVVADVSKLNLGDRLTVADVEISSEITVMTDKDSVIALVTNVQEKETPLDSEEQQSLDNV